MGGSVSYHSGIAAEGLVAQFYEKKGHRIAARRWRSGAGEIDLIARDKGAVVFVEVKKSHSFEAAAAMLSPRQISRIYHSAAVFLDGEPNGQDSDSRFDVALVDGRGGIRIIENAISA